MKRHLTTLVAILVVLGVLIFLFSDSQNLNKTHANDPLFGFTKNDIAAFQVNNFLQGYAFQKDSDSWTIQRVQNDMTKSLMASGKMEQAISTEDATGKPVDLVKVTSLLTHLTTLTIGEPIASEPASAAHFQINQYSPHVILFDKSGKELGRLYIGKPGPEVMTTYVKRNAENDVYLVDESMSGLLLYPYEDWLISDGKTETQDHATPENNAPQKQKPEQKSDSDSAKSSGKTQDKIKHGK